MKVRYHKVKRKTWVETEGECSILKMKQLAGILLH